MEDIIRKIIWIAKITVGLILFLLVLDINLLLLKHPSKGLLDFGSFIASGRFASTGQNPYSTDSSLIFQVVSKTGETAVTSPNLNPPVSVIIFEQIANLDPFTLFTTWRVVSFIIFLLSVYLLMRHYQKSIDWWRLAWAFSLAGLWHTIHLGQIYPPLFLGVSLSWILIDKGYFKITGILLGIIIAIKPNFAFWVLLLAIGGYGQIFVWSAITAVAISLTPIFVYGINIYQQWLHALSEYPSEGLLIIGNSSLQSLSARVGFGSMGILLSLVLVCYTLYFIYRWKPANEVINSLGMVVSLIISPFSWAGYFMLLVPIFFAKHEWSWQYWLAGFIFIIPYIVVLALAQPSNTHAVIFGWTYGWGLLLLLADIYSRKVSSNELKIQ